MIQRYLNLEQLSTQPDVGKILCWVMAANDLALTFYLQSHFAELTQQPIYSAFTIGSRLYCDRLMCAQTSEAIQMVPVSDQIDLFHKCIRTHPEAEIAFANLLQLSGDTRSDEESELVDLLSRIRNKGLFHYFNRRDRNLPSWLKTNLERRVMHDQKLGTAIFCENSNIGRRYTYADDIFQEVFFREILHMDMTNDESITSDTKRLTDKLTNAASDVRVVGDTIAFALLEMYPR